MTLNKHERAALIHKLKETLEEIELQKLCLEKGDPKNAVKNWHEMDLFLLQNTQATIEKALTENEIDY